MTTLYQQTYAELEAQLRELNPPTTKLIYNPDEITWYRKPSLELFQEMIWDRTADLGMTDKEVKELAIWAGHKFLNFSLGELANAWDVSKDSARSVVRKFERRKDKPQGEIDVQNAVLVTCLPE